MSSDNDENLTSFQLTLLLVAVGLCLGSLARFVQINFKLPIPYTVTLLIIGILLGFIEEHIGKLGDAVSLVKSIDPHLLMGAFIPALIFESAFSVNYHTFSREFTQALWLAGPGVLITASLIAVFSVYIFPYNWSWSEATLFGAIASATDPVAVVALLRELGASKRLATLIEGESLLNDGTAFVLYMIALKFVNGENPNFGGVVLDFVQLTFVGAIVGVIFGFIIAGWLKIVFDDSRIEITITIFTCYLCFFVAEIEFHSSGILACVALGIVLSKYKRTISPHIEASLHHVWEILGYMATTLIFVFGGIIIVNGVIHNDANVINLKDTLYLALIYVYIHIVRVIELLILWYPLKHSGYSITFKDSVILCVGGLRGVIGLAMGLLTQLETLNLEANEDAYKYQIMFHTSGIVFLTLVINAVAMKPVIRYLGLDKPSKEAEIILKDAMEHLRECTTQRIEHLKTDYNYSGADWKKVIEYLPSYASMFSAIEQSEYGQSEKYTVTITESAKDSVADNADIDKTVIISKNTHYYWNLCCFYLLFCCKTKREKYSNHGSVRGLARIRFSDGEDIEIRESNAKALKQQHIFQKILSRRFGRRAPAPANSQRAKSFDSGLHDDDIETWDDEQKISKSEQRLSSPLSSVDGICRASLLQSLHTVLNESNLGKFDQQSDILSINAKRKQFQHRILGVMRSSYLTAYEEGRISQSAETALTNAVEYALDYDDIELQYQYLLNFFIIPSFLKKWYGSGRLQMISRHLLFDKLSVAVEVGTVFIQSFQQVKVVLTEIPEMMANELCQACIATLQKHSDDIKEEWFGIQQCYPEVYKAIQTRHAVQHIMHSESEDIEELKLHGLLDETEYDRMMKQLLEAQHRLSFKLFHNITISSQDKKKTLLQLAFCNKVRINYNKKMAHLLDGAVLLLKNRKEAIFESGDIPKGIFVLVRGTAVLSLNGNAKDTYTSGSIFAWEYLSKSHYVCDCIARTSVEFYFLSHSLIQDILKNEGDAMTCLWRSCATNLILAYFRDFFNEYTAVHIASMVQMAIFHKTKDAQERTLTKNTLLLSGTGINILNGNVLSAPMLLSPESQCRFDRDSIFLIFEFDPLAANRFRPLQRRFQSVVKKAEILGLMNRLRRAKSLNMSDLDRNDSSPDITLSIAATQSEDRVRTQSLFSLSKQSRNHLKSSDSVLCAVDESADIINGNSQHTDTKKNSFLSPSFSPGIIRSQSDSSPHYSL